MSMFNDISWGSKDNKKECESSAQLVSLYAKRFSAEQWSFLGPGSEKKWSSDPRVHYPEECSKAKVVENCQYTIALTRERLKLFFAQLFLLISSVFTEQSQICVNNAKLAMLEQGDLL